MAFSIVRSRGSRVHWRSKWIFFLIAAWATTGCAFGDPPSARITEAERLVASAAQSEISGDVAKSVALRRDAARTDHENRLARWQLGEIQVNKKWVPIEDAERRAAGDRQQAEYARLRLAAGDSPESQYALAKWCRKNNLIDESRYHWANVLTADPNNQEALRALDVRWFQGQLVRTAEITAVRKADNVRRRERLAASIGKWRSALEGKGEMPVDEIYAEIRSIHFLDAIQPVEEFIANPRISKDRVTVSQQQAQHHKLSVAFVGALAEMPEHQATEALLRQAVWSSDSDVRQQAIAELKKRPRYDYIPILLDGLVPEVESSYEFETLSDGTVRAVQKLYQPGFETDYEVTNIRELHPNPSLTHAADFATRGLGDDRTSRLVLQSTAPARQIELQGFAATSEKILQNENRLKSIRNDKIIRVLASTTDQDLGNEPRKWWTYWQGENEYYVPPKQPVCREEHRAESFSASCFASGTPVWTKTGKRPIETLEPGDLVLSQNVDTGELRYEPVLACTLRPPCAILRLEFENEELRATKGHPFWVAGTGWRMAKELDVGEILSGLHRASKVRSIESAGEAEAYNLVVAEFNTYFVGDSGILAHDNTPRRPTQAILPGIAKK